MRRDSEAVSKEETQEQAEQLAARERLYVGQLTRNVSRPREWTIRRVETVIGSIA